MVPILLHSFRLTAEILTTRFSLRQVFAISILQGTASCTLTLMAGVFVAIENID